MAEQTSAAPANLTKLTVYLVPAAVVALTDAVEFTTDTATDSVNRAVQVYAEIMRCAAAGGGGFDVRGEAPGNTGLRIIVEVNRGAVTEREAIAAPPGRRSLAVRQRDAARAALERVARERDETRAERDLARAVVAAEANTAQAIQSERDRLAARVNDLTQQVDYWAGQVVDLEADQGRLLAELERVTAERDAALVEVGRG